MEVTKKNVKINQAAVGRHRLSLIGKILGISIVPTLIMGIVLTFVGIRAYVKVCRKKYLMHLKP